MISSSPRIAMQAELNFVVELFLLDKNTENSYGWGDIYIE